MHEPREPSKPSPARQRLAQYSSDLAGPMLGLLGLLWLFGMITALALPRGFRDPEATLIMLLGVVALLLIGACLALLRFVRGAQSYRGRRRRGLGRFRLDELLLTVVAATPCAVLLTRELNPETPVATALTVAMGPLTFLALLLVACWGQRQARLRGVTGLWGRFGLIFCGWLTIPAGIGVFPLVGCLLLVLPPLQTPSEVFLALGWAGLALPAILVELNSSRRYTRQLNAIHERLASRDLAD